MIEKTREALEKLTRSRKKRTAEQIGEVVGQALAKWKVGKFFAWRVCGGKLEWSLEESRVQQEESLDGCYVARTDASREVLDKTQAVGAYRQLALVDRAFRQLKTVALEIRPVDHHLDERIEAHVFLCMLAYYSSGTCNKSSLRCSRATEPARTGVGLGPGSWNASRASAGKRCR